MLSKEKQKELMLKQPQLSVQLYEQIPDLFVLSPEVISRQATINIGTIGHVAHGKSTLVKAITGVHTVRFRDEKVRNITIKLGYANAKIYKCIQCKDPEGYKSFSSDKDDKPKCTKCENDMKLLRHVSFVDCPGHDILMATMLTGAAVMDACLLLIAGNMSCPQPQTSEHLAAVEIMQLNKIIIIQNKVDLIFRDQNAANKNYEEIKKFIQGTRAESSPIIPISAQLNYNIDTVCQYITEYIPIPKRLFNDSPKLIVIRSFDVNKPGDDVEEMKGGIVGGSILSGVLKLGDLIEIRPGEISRNQNGQIVCQSIHSQITSLKAEKNDLLYAVPGGLIGVGLRVDPTLTRSNRLVGQVLGHKGFLPDVYSELEIEFYMLRRLLGVKSDESNTSKVKKISKGETLMLNVGSTQTGGRVEKILNQNILKLSLAIPVCTSTGEKVAISRRIEDKWRLIGWGNVRSGNILNN